MPNTLRGLFNIAPAAGSVYTIDSMASCILAGSAIGYARVGDASVAFPFASQLGQTATYYGFDTALVVINAGSAAWTTDPAVGSQFPNASVGMGLLVAGKQPLIIPGDPRFLAIWSGSAVRMSILFYEGSVLGI